MFHPFCRCFLQIAKKAGSLAWVGGTMAIIVVLPLMFEVDREQTLLEMMQQQRRALMAQGYTPDQIDGMRR